MLGTFLVFGLLACGWSFCRFWDIVQERKIILKRVVQRDSPARCLKLIKKASKTVNMKLNGRSIKDWNTYHGFCEAIRILTSKQTPEGLVILENVLNDDNYKKEHHWILKRIGGII